MILRMKKCCIYKDRQGRHTDSAKVTRPTSYILQSQVCKPLIVMYLVRQGYRPTNQLSTSKYWQTSEFDNSERNGAELFVGTRQYYEGGLSIYVSGPAGMSATPPGLGRQFKIMCEYATQIITD